MSVKAYSDEETYTNTTDQNGDYAFEVNPNVYNIEASSDDDFSKGITTIDIVIIQKYILGLKQITDPYILMAGDVNMNNKVSSSDILQLRRLILGSEDRFTNNSWIGVNANYEFENPTHAYEEAEQATKIKVDISDGQSLSQLDFNAIKIGDMNKSHQTAEFRSSDALKFKVENRSIYKGQSIEIPFLASDFNDIYGFQCAINIAGLENVQLKPVAININDDNTNIKDGKLLISWDDASGITLENDKVLFILTAQATADGVLNNILNINDRLLRAEAYSGKELSIRNVNIDFVDYSFALYQNQPNPFSNETAIGFDLPENGEYELKISDMTGKEIYKVRAYGKLGYNKITVKGQDILASGVYYYQLSTDNYTDTKKMVFYR
ncbi:MAG: T9SS type A sorting domain-containing protein [Saprospiraceae bacterium]